MRKHNNRIFKRLFILSLVIFSCKNASKEAKIVDNASLLDLRYQYLLDYRLDSISIPRSWDKQKQATRGVPSKDWTSGFFAGNLWQLYELTQDKEYRDKALQWTQFLEKEKINAGTHDMGFKIFSSYGKGYQYVENPKYKSIILEAAKTLSTRFNTKVGAIRSWDWDPEGMEYPVIVDNLMNLELLFEATKLSQDSIYHNIAVTHLNTTLNNHFREDNSIFHVVDYDTITGKVKRKFTHQGYSDNSSWARGLGWGIYGFTLAHRYTGEEQYLAQAEAISKYYLNHQNLPSDGIPYWDFDDPDIPDAPRDVSAATIIASAFYELQNYSNFGDEYIEYANKVLSTLQSDAYLLDQDVEAPFILDHSTGNWPRDYEIDEPIVYADYYFLEALIRKKTK